MPYFGKIDLTAVAAEDQGLVNKILEPKLTPHTLTVNEFTKQRFNAPYFDAAPFIADPYDPETIWPPDGSWLFTEQFDAPGPVVVKNMSETAHAAILWASVQSGVAYYYAKISPGGIFILDGDWEPSWWFSLISQTPSETALLEVFVAGL
jgi:hypothetical protein